MEELQDVLEAQGLMLESSQKLLREHKLIKAFIYELGKPHIIVPLSVKNRRYSRKSSTDNPGNCRNIT